MRLVGKETKSRFRSLVPVDEFCGCLLFPHDQT